MSAPEPTIGDELAPAAAARVSLPSDRFVARGDRIALKWWFVGVGAYIALFSAVVVGGAVSGGAYAVGQFVGYSDAGWNFSVLVVVCISFVVTLSVFIVMKRDIDFLAGEEVDIEWLIENGVAYVHFLLVPKERRRDAVRAGVVPPLENWRTPTLLSDRVRRVYSATKREDGSRPSPEQMRFFAESRTARFGQTPRYAASLLLLLTVLGTFSGVKTALPALINAVGGAQGDMLSIEGIARPLSAVAEAFGANSFALIGAIAIGLISHGFAIGRIHLLERLEVVSEEVLFAGLNLGTGQPLEIASKALTTAAEQMVAAQAALDDMALAIQGLEEATRDGNDQLRGSLTALASRSDEEFFRYSAKQFGAVEERLGRLEDAVTVTATAYGAFVGQMDDKAAELKTAVTAFTAANTVLADALTDLKQLETTSAASTKSVSDASVSIAESLRALNVEATELKAELKAPTSSLNQSILSLAGQIREMRNVPGPESLDRSSRPSYAVGDAVSGPQALGASAYDSGMRELMQALSALKASVDSLANGIGGVNTPRGMVVAQPEPMPRGGVFRHALRVVASRQILVIVGVVLLIGLAVLAFVPGARTHFLAF